MINSLSYTQQQQQQQQELKHRMKLKHLHTHKKSLMSGNTGLNVLLKGTSEVCTKKKKAKLSYTKIKTTKKTIIMWHVPIVAAFLCRISVKLP